MNWQLRYKVLVRQVFARRWSDQSPIKDLPLTTVRSDFQPERDAEILRSIKTLETINGKPAAEFWKEVEKK